MSVQIFCYMNHDNELSTCLYHQILYLRLATVCNCSLFNDKTGGAYFQIIYVVVSRETALTPYLYVVNRRNHIIQE